MRLNVIIFLLYIVFGSSYLNAQSYNYTYIDPCTGNQKTIVVPANGAVTIGYYGYVESFTYDQLTNGTFENWTNNIASQFEGSPCSEIVGISNVVTTAQQTTLNVIGIINSLSVLSDFSSVTNGGSNMLSGAVNTTNGASNSKSEDDKNKKEKNGNNGESSTTTGTNEGSETGKGNETTNQGNGETTQTEGGGTSGEGTTNGSGNKTTEQPVTGNGGSGQPETPTTEQTTPTETEGKTNITAGGTNTIKSSTTSNGSSSRNKEGGKPSIVASSDFVGFNFRNSDVKLGAKASGGYTALRWDGARSWGTLVDYTSALKGPNITGFYAWLKNKNVTLASATLTLGFEGRGSIYGTLTGGYMKTFKKVKNLKGVFLGTITYGKVYNTNFLGTAMIAGGTYEFKVGKRLDVRLMDLMIYSPYVSYYNDVVMKSPYVMLPSLGVNIGITKRFKLNINGGGAWSIGVSTLNYTITCGTRLLIGSD